MSLSLKSAVAATSLVSVLALPAAASAKTVTVTASKSGKSVTLAKGDKLVVTLAENPSTGYSWKTVTKPAFLRQLSSKYAPNKVDSDVPLVGGGGKRTFTYAVLRKGSGTLKLRYVPPSPDGSGTTFTLRVTAR